MILKQIATFLLLIHIVLGRKCNVGDLIEEQCSRNETCIEQELNEGICKCLDGFKRLNVTTCVNGTKPERSTPNTESLIDKGSSGHLVAGILIPLCLIAFVIMGVYYSRKYRLITWIQMKINQRNVSNYDEVMIGQDLDDDDEPPLC